MKSDRYLLVTIIVVASRQISSDVNTLFDKLRFEMGLRKAYEFHASSNSNSIRKVVYKNLKNIDFKFITVAIEKDTTKRRGSYTATADMLLYELKECFGNRMEVRIDSNPTLLKALNRAKKKIGYKKIYFGEDDSSRNNMIQLADYVAACCAKVIKGDKAELSNYKYVQDKMLIMKIDKL